MRIDFVKEKKGEVIWYYTSIDGEYVTGSLSHDSEKAMEFYERVLDGTSQPEITIIRTTNIENGTTTTKP